MSDIKKFSDYEEMFIESIKDKTIGELMDTYCHLDSHFMRYHDKSHGLFFGNSYFIDTRSIQYELVQEFFHFASRQEGFKEIPILGSIYIREADCDAYAVEEISEYTYKVIYYSFYGYYFVYKQLSHYKLEPSPHKTIGDFSRAIGSQLV